MLIIKADPENIIVLIKSGFYSLTPAYDIYDFEERI